MIRPARNFSHSMSDWNWQRNPQSDTNPQGMAASVVIRANSMQRISILRQTSVLWPVRLLYALMIAALLQGPMAEASNGDDSPVIGDFPSVTTAESDTGLIAVPDQTLPVPLQSLSEASPSVPCDGFWIVSTHQSPQSFDNSMPRFCPGAMYYDQCRGYRQSSFAELCQSLVPGVPVCIAVHGSFVDWESVCNESRGTWQWLKHGCPDRPLQVIYMTWPSDRPYTPLVQFDIGMLGRRAARNGFYLADIIRHIPPDCPISLVGHSHGTRVIASGLHLMGGGSIENIQHVTAQNSGRRIRAVFVASAIDHDWLNPSERYGCALRSAECILNMQNHLDPCLAIYPLRRPFSSRALGHSGFTNRDLRELQGWSWKVRNADVSHVVGAAHLWPNYYRRMQLSHLMSSYVFFPDHQMPMPAAPNTAELHIPAMESTVR
jgi:hypothetical protein